MTWRYLCSWNKTNSTKWGECEKLTRRGDRGYRGDWRCGVQTRTRDKWYSGDWWQCVSQNPTLVYKPGGSGIVLGGWFLQGLLP
jgi:hypothetical protein